ncbi:MAG: ribose-5-phosphate isomerase RpiA [Gammaproteobacteria bacterium]|nr:ribose-5-phosphate isomerase RpiA [Gammaproteobacteria bacterium]
MSKLQELKEQVAQAALEYVPTNRVIGVGSGSTVECFIHALAKRPPLGAVATSHRTAQCLLDLGIRLIHVEDIVGRLEVYIDGADEIDPKGNMVKGGGGALTQEKLVAAHSDQFICIADESKMVPKLGKFPIPIEVLPKAHRFIMQQCIDRGWCPKLRMDPLGSTPFSTDNGMYIMDVSGISVDCPQSLEAEISAWVGVLTVGLFARQSAHIALIAHAQGQGVKTYLFET